MSVDVEGSVVAAATALDKDGCVWDSVSRVLGINVFSCFGCTARLSQLCMSWYLLNGCA